MERHISHYFEFVNNLLNHQSTSLEQMRNMLVVQNCPKDKIEFVINGVLKDVIQGLIPKEGTSLNELHIWLSDKVTDITTSYVDKLLKYMTVKGMINIIDGTEVYNLKIFIPNCPIDLNEV
ncbi:hypothetical protein [Dysgonomonas sp. 520]|uniref:hypothetical protein n=1 Tax=Dysgonomonas sp. 520 TaxID=2302931 RepID=UPI0013D00EE1|nr:hypothetical protein [Dysgonomonas sp. 520]NDW09422.1 hypothetical protein [Dysgonomonas sp. 520]